MKPSIKLIAALRRAADIIETAPLFSQVSGFDEQCEVAYSHQHSQNCNCGWLARALGIDRRKLHQFAYYTDAANKHFDTAVAGVCNVTLRPMLEVLKCLADAGLEKKDFRNIEFLQDTQVLARAGLKRPYVDSGETHNDQESVARYFRAQADLLEEQLQQEQAVEKNLRQVEQQDRMWPQDIPLAGPANGQSQKSPSGHVPAHLPQSLSPVTSALAKQLPCHHMPMFGLCVYCGCAMPVERKEITI